VAELESYNMRKDIQEAILMWSVLNITSLPTAGFKSFCKMNKGFKQGYLLRAGISNFKYHFLKAVNQTKGHSSKTVQARFTVFNLEDLWSFLYRSAKTLCLCDLSFRK